MAIKQKIAFLMVAVGLTAGVLSILLITPSYAQIDPADPADPGPGCRVDTPQDCAPGEKPAGGDAADAVDDTKDDCDATKDTCCDKVKTSIISDADICGTPTADGGIIFGLLKWVLRIMTAGVGIAAVGGIVYGAILYSSAGNKPEQTKKAIGIISNVVVGIVAYAAMFILLNFLVPGGVFK